MTRSLLAAAVAGLVAAAVAVPVAHARPGVTRPVPTTLYFHGAYPAGEVDEAQGLVDGTFMAMDPTPPSGPAPKSKTFGWANTNCAGNRGFVVWVGHVSGRIVGDIKLTFTSVSIPQEVDVRIWPDTTTLQCGGDYSPPLAYKKITVPQGRAEVHAVIHNVDIDARDALMVQLSPTPMGTDYPGPGRVLYDSTDAASNVRFECIPAKGSACS